jgi:hypothetical protein
MEDLILFSKKRKIIIVGVSSFLLLSLFFYFIVVAFINREHSYDDWLFVIGSFNFAFYIIFSVVVIINTLLTYILESITKTAIEKKLFYIIYWVLTGVVCFSFLYFFCNR